MKQNKNFIISLAVGLLIIGGLIVWSGQNQAGNSIAAVNLPPSELQASEPNFDFGSVSMAAGKVSHVFALENTGATPVTIKSIYTSCMCTEANLIFGDQKIGPFGMIGMADNPAVDKTIPAQGTVGVEAVFNPAAHGPAGIGAVERQIVIETNDNREVVLNFQAQVTP